MEHLNIEFTANSSTPGGEYTTIKVNGENRGEVYPGDGMSLGKVLKVLLRRGNTYSCNNLAAVNEYNLIK